MNTASIARGKTWTQAEIEALPDSGLLPGFRYPVADLFKEWEWD